MEEHRLRCLWLTQTVCVKKQGTLWLSQCYQWGLIVTQTESLNITPNLCFSVRYLMTLSVAKIAEHCDERIWSIGGMTMITKSMCNKRRTCSSAILYTTNLTWSGLWLNPCLRSERLAANCLCHCTMRVNSRAGNCALKVSSLWQTLLITSAYWREYLLTQQHLVIEHCRMVRAIVRSNFLRIRCGSRRLRKRAGEHSDLPVLCTEGCQYKSVLCVWICKDLCEITKNVQQARFRTCSPLFLLIAIIFQHSPKNVDAFVPNWHQYKYFV